MKGKAMYFFMDVSVVIEGLASLMTPEAVRILSYTLAALAVVLVFRVAGKAIRLVFAALAVLFILSAIFGPQFAPSVAEWLMSLVGK